MHLSHIFHLKDLKIVYKQHLYQIMMEGLREGVLLTPKHPLFALMITYINSYEILSYQCVIYQSTFYISIGYKKSMKSHGVEICLSK